LGQGPRARMLFGLAHVLDAQGDYARAADCLRVANALTLEMQRGAHHYAPAQHERFVDDLLTTFGRDFFARMAGAGLSTRRPVFVFGLPRSGTTLIEQVLASHSRVHGSGELRLGRMSLEAFHTAPLRPATTMDNAPLLDAMRLRWLAQQHERQLWALDGGRA